MNDFRLLERYESAALAGDWVRILPTGSFSRYGRAFTITPAMIQEMAHNFGRVPNYAIPLTLVHDDAQGRVGTLQAVQARADGLYGRLAFTARGRQLVEQEAFAYLSPEVMFDEVEWEGQRARNFLVGLTLTNKPYFGELALFAFDGAQVQAFATWTAAYINDLPDSAFLHIEPGGAKDDEGKTTPRSLRHFPYRDSGGKVDLPHLRNALARIPQSSLPAAVKRRVIAKAQRIARDAGIETAQEADIGGTIVEENMVSLNALEKLAAFFGFKPNPQPSAPPPAQPADNTPPPAEFEALKRAKEEAEQKLARLEAEAKAAQAAAKFQAELKDLGAGWGEKLARVAGFDAALADAIAERFKALLAQADPKLLGQTGQQDPGGAPTPVEKFQTLVQERLDKDPKLSLEAAQRAVERANPDLAAQLRAAWQGK